MNLWRAAVAASAPSEEGAGAPKGFRGATEGERTRGCCLHKGVDVHKFIQVSFLLCVRLYKVLLHTLGVSLLPSRRFYPLYAVPPPSSEGGEGAPVPCAHILISPRFTCKALFVRFLSPLRARQRPAGCFPARSLCAGRCPPSPGDSPWL